MSEGYAKLWSSILVSTVWQEPLHVKVVWITMLALADVRGYVGASVPGLASTAGVTVEQCEDALKRFHEPDTYSRTQTFEGRRIVDADGGWMILSWEKHQHGREVEERRQQNREAQQRFRQARRAAKETEGSKQEDKQT